MQGWWEREDDEVHGTTLYLKGDGTFQFEVTGARNAQEELEEVAGGRTEESCDHECVARLMCYKNNPHDPLAVAVAIGENVVAHLSRANARSYREQMIAAGGSPIAACRARIVGGWDRGEDDRGMFGVRLDLAWPIELRRKAGAVQ